MLLKGLKKLIQKSADKPAKLKLKLELTKAYRFDNIKLALQEGNQTLVLAKTQKNVALGLQPAFEPPKTKIAQNPYQPKMKPISDEEEEKQFEQRRQKRFSKYMD